MREPLVPGSREAGGERRAACPRAREHSRAHPLCTTSGSAWSCAPSTPSTTSCSSGCLARRRPMRSARGKGAIGSFTPSPRWRPRVPREPCPEGGQEKIHRKIIQASPSPTPPVPCPPSAQGENKDAVVRRDKWWLGGPPGLGDSRRLAPDCRLNPHRSLLGTGNYDVNVIMAALQGLGLAAVWWDRRRPLSQLALPQVLGLILNLPSPVSLGLLSLPLRRRHWVALRQVDGVYYNLDSKLRAPEALGDENGVRAFLAAALAQDPCQVLLVVTKEVEEKGCWLRTH
ncbi:josephin-2 isoform 2-T2 [Glossophaga mutica]